MNRQEEVVEKITRYPQLLIAGVIIGLINLLNSEGIASTLLIGRFIGTVFGTLISGRLARRSIDSEIVLGLVLLFTGGVVAPLLVTLIFRRL